jgi:hypothetical protein
MISHGIHGNKPPLKLNNIASITFEINALPGASLMMYDVMHLFTWCLARFTIKGTQLLGFLYG